MFKNKTMQRIVSVIVSVLVLLYLGFQLHNVLKKTVSTEFAVPYTYDDKISVTGYVVRDESIMTGSNGGGIISYTRQSGSKVSAGSTVAEVFSSEEQASAKSRIAEIDSELSRLTELKESGNRFSASAELLDLKINDSINQMLEITDTGNLKGFSDAENELLEYINKKQIATGKLSGFDARVTELEAQKASLQSSVGTPSEIVCDKAGYFVNEVDGYEGVIPFDSISSLTVEQLKGAESVEPSPDKSAIGKVFSGNEWYIAAVLSNENVKNMAVGDTRTLYMPLVTSTALSCTVAFMNVDYASDQTMVAFKCDRMDPELVNARIETVEVCVGSYDGLRVNSAAIRIVEGVTGVYVLSGITADFKTVDLLYSDSSFAVCKYDVSGASALKIYDEVIVEGSDLYDGKTVK